MNIIKSIFSNCIHIDESSKIPKYLQLSNSILDGLRSGEILKDQLLPSIAELSRKLDISRDTAEKSYNHLKKLGLTASVPGKGFYVTNIDPNRNLKIFLLFNKLSSHKKIIYDAFVESILDNASIDFYIYNNDFLLFEKLLTSSNHDYTHYVIIPHFSSGEESAAGVINSIPKEKLVLVDKKTAGIKGEYAAVFENFEKDIFEALEEGLALLKKYHTLKIIFPENSYYPLEIIIGFKKFCRQYCFSHRVVNDISCETMRSGTAFIILTDEDLVILIDRLAKMKLKVGEDIGIISYNETPIKKIILNGITTISTDFYQMGKIAAQSILDNSHQHIEVPFHLTVRNSL